MYDSFITSGKIVTDFIDVDNLKVKMYDSFYRNKYFHYK